MSGDVLLRTLGVVVGLYSAGLLVTLMSLAALEAAGLSVAAPLCAPGDCKAVAVHHLPPAVEPSDTGVLATAAYIAASF